MRGPEGPSPPRVAHPHSPSAQSSGSDPHDALKSQVSCCGEEHSRECSSVLPTTHETDERQARTRLLGQLLSPRQGEVHGGAAFKQELETLGLQTELIHPSVTDRPRRCVSTAQLVCWATRCSCVVKVMDCRRRSTPGLWLHFSFEERCPARALHTGETMSLKL